MTPRSRQRLIYVAGDYLATNVAWLLFNAARYYLLPRRTWSFHSLEGYLTSTTVVAGQILFPLLMLGIYWISGYYENVFRKSRAEEFTTTASATFAGSLLIFFVVLLNDMTDNLLLDWGLLAIMFGMLFTLVYSVRLATTRTVTRRLRRGEISFPTIVVGEADEAADFITHTDTPRFMGFRMAGIADPHATGHSVSQRTGLPVVELDSIEQLAAEVGAENIVVLPSSGESDTLRLINRLFPLEKRIFIFPDELHMLLSRPRTTNIVGDPLLDISRTDVAQSTVNLKRLGDIFLSALTLVALAPILAAVAIAVRIDSPGPAFYRQRRIGYHKRPFDIIKFRTMTTDAESEGPRLSQGDDDPRITRIGRFLRKYRIDELPQFWNVLRGEMSIVGPRPEREHYIARIMERAPYYALLHQVRPGITSWGMVRYGYASNVDQMIERLKFDMLYIGNLSFAVDMKIVFYTVSTVIKGKGQ